MYSATFAMIVIIGIAVTNLFLGFATAMLLGRGPKRLSDIDRAIVLEPVDVRGWRPAPRPTVERMALNLEPAPAPPQPQPTTPVEQPAVGQQTSDGATPAPAETAIEPAPRTAPAQPAPTEVRKIVLPPSNLVIENENDPPQKVLSQQLDTWRHGDLSDETPSMSGLALHVQDENVGDALRDALADAVYQRIKGHIRKDRRILRMGRDQFAWFSCDVSPVDALMPVERIRQVLAKTRFRHQEQPLEISVRSGVVIGLKEDDAAGLLERLRQTLHYAAEQGADTSCLDVGHGPQRQDPQPFEVGESECLV